MAHFVPKTDPKDIHVYDDDGKLITNPEMLEAFLEGQQIIADWIKSLEPCELVDDDYDPYDWEEEVVGK